MARIFISHSSADNAAALALAQWLHGQGWSDFFLDFETERGIAPGERWMAALAGAVERCEAVVFVISPAWQASKFCFAEFFQARTLGKRLFAVIVQPVELSALPEQMTGEWQVCDLTGVEDPAHFNVEQPPHVPPTQVVFSGVALAALARGLSRAGLAPSSFIWPPEVEPGRSPYPGLRALDEADAAVFFGRDAAIVRAMDQLRQVRDREVERLFVVLGASGAGKSSFLRAGLLPRMRRDSDHFVVLPTLRPERAALSGAQGLLPVLQQALTAAGHAFGLRELRDELDRRGLATVLRRIEAGTHAGRRTVILPVDQGEELWAADGQAEARALLNMIAGLSSPTPAADRVRVLFVMTIRSDSLPRLQTQPVLQALSPVFFSLPAMPVSEFKAVIEGPARRHSATVRPLEISPELTDELVADAKGPDALPLLALTLDWLYREYTTPAGTRIGHDEYQRLGGVRGVIDSAVQRALARPGQEPVIAAEPAAQEQLLQQLFPFIASVDPDSGEWKRRVAMRWAIREAAPQLDALVSRLVEQRLLLSDARPVPGGGLEVLAEVVEVAHEALLRQWSALEEWLRLFASDLSNAETLRRAANDWQRSGRDEALLVHTRGRLEAAESLLSDERLKGRFEAGDEAYVAACWARDRRQLQEREAQLQRIAEQQRARAQLQRRAAAGLAGATAIVLGFVAWNVRQTQAVSRQSSLVLASAAESAQASDSAVRLALLASQDSWLHPAHPAAWPVLAQTMQRNTLRRRFAQSEVQTPPVFSPDGTRLLKIDEGQAVLLDVETGAAIGKPLPHAERVAAAWFWPDGSRIGTVTTDKDRNTWQARVWEAATGRVLSESPRRPGRFWSAVINTNGTRLLTILDADHAQAWDMSTWAPVGRRVEHDNEILGAAYSPDGKTFVTFAKDNKAVVWLAETGEPVGAPMVHESIPQSAQFSTDGRMIMTQPFGKPIQLWDATTGQSLAGPSWYSAYATTGEFGPGGGHVVQVVGKEVRVVDLATGSTVNLDSYPDPAPRAMGFSADGRRIATVTGKDVVQVWDVATGLALGPAMTGGSGITAVRFSADGRRVLARGRDTAWAWDATLGAPVAAPARMPDDESRVRLMPDGRRVLVHRLGARLQSFDAGDPRALAQWPAGDAVVGDVDLSPDGNWIIAREFRWNVYEPLSTSETVLRLVDARSGTVRTLGSAAQKGFTEHSFNAVGTRLLTLSESGAAQWDLATAQPLGPTLALPPQRLAVAFAPGDRGLRVWTDPKAPRAVDSATGHPTGPALQVDGPVGVRLSPTGGRMIIAGAGGSLELWDEDQRKPLRRLRDKARSGAPTASFSPDGRRVVLPGAAAGEPVRVFDAATGETVSELLGDASQAQFSRDSRLVLTWGGPVVGVWDAATGRRVTAALFHKRPVISAETGADGRSLLTLDRGRVVRLFAVPDIVEANRAAMRARACEGLDPDARAVRVEDMRAAPLIEPKRIGEDLCNR